jgi:hypothetical protein
MPKVRTQVLPMKGKDQREEKEKANKQNLQHLHQQDGQKSRYTIFDQEEKNGNVIAIKANKQANKEKGSNASGCQRRLFQP